MVSVFIFVVGGVGVGRIIFGISRVGLVGLGLLRGFGVLVGRRRRRMGLGVGNLSVLVGFFGVCGG